MTLLSRRLIHLAIFCMSNLSIIHRLFDAQTWKFLKYSGACLSVICFRYFLVLFRLGHCDMLCDFSKNVYMNMNFSYPPTIYKFLVEKYF